MRKLEKLSRAYILDWEELSPLEKNLFRKAAEVRKNAQAPYSGYMVGVAIRSASGKIYTGVNVERVTYSETSHAEQVAIDTMVAREGPNKVVILVGVSGPRDQKIILPPKAVPLQASNLSLDEFWFPCGRCRQIIWENSFADPDVLVLWFHPAGLFAQARIRDLLSNRFGPEKLGIDYRQTDK